MPVSNRCKDLDLTLNKYSNGLYEHDLSVLKDNLYIKDTLQSPQLALDMLCISEPVLKGYLFMKDTFRQSLQW